jgi:integrase
LNTAPGEEEDARVVGDLVPVKDAFPHKQKCLKPLVASLEFCGDSQENDYVLCTSHGTPFAAANLRTEFKALLKKAELPDIRFHDLRHSVAILLLELGTYPKNVQEPLGHENIGMTMDIYSHVMPSIQKEAMAKLNELLGGSQHKDEGSLDRGEDNQEERS